MKSKLRALICRWLGWAYHRWGYEERCPMCKERSDCPAYESGVAWPCPYYQKEDT